MVILYKDLIKVEEIESGVGKADLLFYKKDLSKGYLLEFMKLRNKESIDKLHLKAKEQIEDREYELIFEKLGIKEVNVYTVVCENKTCILKRLDKKKIDFKIVITHIYLFLFVSTHLKISIKTFYFF